VPSTLPSRFVVILVILTLPIAIAVVNSSAPFGNTGCDSWHWFGLYTFNYGRFWNFMSIMAPSAYTLGRLPGMLPGFVLYHLFSPVTASYLLYLLLFWTTLAALYIAARQFVQQWSALLAAVLYGFTPFALWTAGNSYIGGIMNCYLTICLAVATIYFRTRATWALWTTLTMMVCTIYAHLMASVYLVSVGLLLLVAPLRGEKVISFWQAIGGLLWRGLIALVAVTIIFGAINEVLVGRFWFFIPQFANAFAAWSRYVLEPVTPGYVLTRPFLFFVIFVFYDTLKWLREYGWSARRALAADYGVVLAIFWVQIVAIFLAQVLHMRAEQYDEYNELVVGFAFVVLSFRVLVVPTGRRGGGIALILGAASLGLALSNPGLRGDYLSETLKLPQGAIHLALLAIIMASFTAETLLSWPQRGQWLRSSVIAVLCLASISGVSFSSYQPHVRGSEAFQNPQEYRAVNVALGAMNALLPEGIPQIWSNVGVEPTHEHVSYLLRHAITVASSACPLGYFWNAGFPKIEAGHIAPGDPLAILVKADMTNALEKAGAALAPLGLRFEFRGQTAIDYTGGPYVLIMGVVRESGA